MSVFTRQRPVHDPDAARAQLEHARLMAQLDQERRAAAAEATRRQAIVDEQERRRRDAARRAERAEAKERRRKGRAEFGAKLRPVLPLLLINGGAAYAQAAYAFEQIAPAEWNAPSRAAFAVAFSAALESVAVYVQWHAHDALLLKAYGTAGRLRRAAWVIAAVVAAINYAHFAHGVTPTAAAVAFALLSLLSPWLWGLHTRRAQHVQLLAEDASLIDDGGAEFSPERRRAFPVRSWMARRWSIDHGERDPRRAWAGYNAERQTRRAGRHARKLARAGQGKTAKVKRADPAPAPAGDDLDALVVATAPAPTLASRPATDRPRWRPTTTRRPRRMAAMKPATQPAINVTVVAPDRATTPATPAATDGRSKPAKKAATRPATTADAVAAALAKKPAMTQADVAAALNLGERTVRRYWPKQTATVNGHDHGTES
jgi:hypothetical protein